MENKKLSIKVKSKTERRIMEDPEVEMITEWNLKRIISAVSAFLIFIILPAYYFSQDDTDADKYAKIIPIENESNIKKLDSIRTETAEETFSQTPEKENTSVQPYTEDPVTQISSVKSAELVHTEIKPEDVVAKDEKQAQTLSQPSESQYSNPHITRAQLAQGINKLTPYGQVDLPLLVDNTKAQGLFYFTEVIDMKGSTVFHEWLKDDKSIYKRKVIIRSNKSRFYTSKLFPYTSVGQWQVRIITEQGEILHKINFSVEKR